MTAAPNQNLKTSKHLDNSGASCNSKLQTFQNLFNSLITVANSQKFKTRGQAVALAANQNNNSEIAGLFCLQLEIKNSRQSLRIAASKRPRTFETLTNQSKDKSVSSNHTGGKISSQDLIQQVIEHVPVALWHHWPVSRTPSSYGAIFGAGYPIRNRPP